MKTTNEDIQPRTPISNNTRKHFWWFDKWIAEQEEKLSKLPKVAQIESPFMVTNKDLYDSCIISYEEYLKRGNNAR